jgi:LPXTG-motif cell wall-anchored protein
MKTFSVLLLILGAIVTIIGILPFMFAYPYSDGPNSGPSNVWELILIISYEGWGWYLIIGIVLLLFSSFSLFKQRKRKLVL